VDIQGKTVNPSTFNIFRDSIKKTSLEIRETLHENLPELKLDETTESDDNEEVVPLDFRTKLLAEKNSVVMQAKPLKIYRSDDEDGESIVDLIRTNKNDYERRMLQMSSDDFLKRVKKESFKDDEENVILIQPNMNIQEKLNAIDLECNKNEFLNNSINAPKVKTKPPKVNKVYKQEEDEHANMKMLNQVSKRKKKVTINETPIEGKMSYAPEASYAHEFSYEPEVSYEPEQIPEETSGMPSNELLDFDKILENQGINLDELLDENKAEKPKQEPVVFNKDTIMQLLTMSGMPGMSMQDIASFIGESAANQEEDEAEPEPEDDQHNSENEVAPMGAIVDEESVPKTETVPNGTTKNSFRRSVYDAYSGSEDDRGYKDGKNPYLSSEEEMIETTKEGLERAKAKDELARSNPSVLKNQKIKSSGTSTNSSAAKVKSTCTDSGLIVQIPGLFYRPTKEAPKPADRKVDENLKPDSFLFKRHDDGEEEKAAPLVEHKPMRPYTAKPKAPKKINYRGVWIEASVVTDEEENSDEDRHFINQQRELMKQKLKKQNNTEFGEVDKIKMENVGVEIVGGNKLVKVERNWDSSMNEFDSYAKDE